VVDLRNRVAFASGHVAGSFNFELEGQLTTYLAWLIPWGKPVTLLAGSMEQIAAAQRELARVGIERPAAAATGEPSDWVREGESPVSFPRGTFADLAARHPGDGIVVLDVRRDFERDAARVEGAVRIPVHELHRRTGAVTGVLGVGGGFLAVPALVGGLGLGMRAAVGTSLLVITVNSLAALAMRAGTADGLDWAVTAPFAVLGAWDGKRLAGKVSGSALQRIFALVLLAVAALMLADAVL
jgi:hypothetical protein